MPQKEEKGNTKDKTEDKTSLNHLLRLTVIDAHKGKCYTPETSRNKNLILSLIIFITQ